METFLQDPPSNEYYDGNGQQGPPNRLQLGRADTAPMVHGHMQQNQQMNMQPSNYGGMYVILCIYPDYVHFHMVNKLNLQFL